MGEKNYGFDFVALPPILRPARMAVNVIVDVLWHIDPGLDVNYTGPVFALVPHSLALYKL